MRRCPKKSTFLKQSKGGSGKVSCRGVELGILTRGMLGLIVLESGRITARQREACRRRRRHGRQRRGLLWRRGYPMTPVTAKPRAVRMGKGKGSVAFWAIHVRPGHRRFEVSNTAGAEQVLRQVGGRRGVGTKLVRRL